MTSRANASSDNKICAAQALNKRGEVTCYYVLNKQDPRRWLTGKPQTPFAGKPICRAPACREAGGHHSRPDSAPVAASSAGNDDEHHGQQAPASIPAAAARRAAARRADRRAAGWAHVHPARTKVRSPARPRARRPGPAPAGFRWARARRSLRPRAARDIDRARLLPRQAREDRPAAPWYTRVHYIECDFSKCCSRV